MLPLTSNTIASLTGPSFSALNPTIGRVWPPSTMMKSRCERSGTNRPFRSRTTAATETKSTADRNLRGRLVCGRCWLSRGRRGHADRLLPRAASIAWRRHREHRDRRCQHCRRSSPHHAAMAVSFQFACQLVKPLSRLGLRDELHLFRPVSVKCQLPCKQRKFYAIDEISSVSFLPCLELCRRLPLCLL